MATGNKNRDEILILTGCSEALYHDTVYELGLKYAEHYTNHKEEDVRFLVETKSYWSWWANQFEIIDRKFLSQGFERCNDSKVLFNTWLRMHVPEEMVAFPGKQVLEDSYALMIGNLFKEKARK